jgi:quercetin dioxygenase-like cupin family protein
MALPHAAPAEAIELAALRQPGTLSSALFKTEQLEVMHLVVDAGKSLPPHHVAGPMTVQCLAGEVRFSAAGKNVELRTGQMLYLLGGETYSLVALHDSALLVTLVLQG